MAPPASTFFKLIVSIHCSFPLVLNFPMRLLFYAKLNRKRSPCSIIYYNSAQLRETHPTNQGHIGGKSLLWIWPVELLTDSFMYADKEALSCRTGQLSELHAEPQHLSDWLVKEGSWELSVCASLWARGTVCVYVKYRLLIWLCVMSDLESSALIKSLSS